MLFRRKVLVDLFEHGVKLCADAMIFTAFENPSPKSVVALPCSRLKCHAIDGPAVKWLLRY